MSSRFSHFGAVTNRVVQPRKGQSGVVRLPLLRSRSALNGDSYAVHLRQSRSPQPPPSLQTVAGFALYYRLHRLNVFTTAVNVTVAILHSHPHSRRSLRYPLPLIIALIRRFGIGMCWSDCGFALFENSLLYSLACLWLMIHVQVWKW